MSRFYYVAAELAEVQLRKDRSSATGVTKQGRTHSGQDPNVEVGALASRHCDPSLVNPGNRYLLQRLAEMPWGK